MIFILNRQEKVINILKNNGVAGKSVAPFFDDVLTEDLGTGSETFQFSTISTNTLSKDICVGNFVSFLKDGKYKLFQIMQLEEIHEETIYIKAYCESAGLELINKVFRKTKINSASLRKFLENVLENTGWTVGLVEATSLVSYDLELEDSTVYATLQNNISLYGCELEFRVEIKNNKIVGKYVDAYGNRGRVTGKRFVFGKDIEGITRKTDSTMLATALIGKGRNGINFRDVVVEGVDKPMGQDYVADQISFDKYNHKGYHIMGVFDFDTDSPEELLRQTYKELQKVKEVRYEYEVNVALLGKLLGKKWDNVNIGDTVAIVDNSFNPPINLMARVSVLETSITNPMDDVCTLSNFIEVKSNISNEMRQIASQLEGYVDSSISNKFPVGGDDIAQGGVNGSHIYQNSITTDHLLADSITSNKIQADQINVNHLQSDSINSDKIQANSIEAKHLQSDSITADKIVSGTITAESGIIADATIGTAQIIDAAITNAKIGNLSADKITTGTLDASRITVKNLNADTITSGSINSNLINISDTTNLANLVNSKDLEKNYLISGRDYYISNPYCGVEISEGDEFIFEFYCKTQDSNVTKALNGLIEYTYTDGSKHWRGSGIAIASECRDWTKRSGTIKTEGIDNNKTLTEYRFMLQVDELKPDSNSENWIVKQIIVRRKSGGKLIVDGSISTNHIQTGSITADSGIISSLSADVIKTGVLDASLVNVKNLNADNISAGSISTGMLEIRDMTNLATKLQESAKKEYLISTRDNPIAYKYLLASDCKSGAEFYFEMECKVATPDCSQPLNAMIFMADANQTPFNYPASVLCDASFGQEWTRVSATVTLGHDDRTEYILPLLQVPEMPSDPNTNNWLVRNVVVRRKSGGKLIVDGSISANHLQVNSVNADKIISNSIETSHLKANSIVSDKIQSNQILAKHIKAGEISVDKLSASAIESVSVSASTVVANKISSGEIKVGNANIVDGTISGAKISKASIDNASIKDATIESAKIRELNAGKITTGTLDATRVKISSTSGNLTISDNTIQIKDAQTSPKVRVQIGKDSKNQYGIIVTNAKGQAIFDSDKGVLIPEGLGSNVVSEDKIVNGAIGSSKLNVDELFVGENAFISSLKAVEIDASSITTGTISNERIDITGLVSFEALDESLKPVFDVQGDKTFINGGVIATNTIKADKIDLLSGLTVKNKKGGTTFAISNDGEVEIDGLLKSRNYEKENTGYKIDTDGSAEFNQVKIRGEIELPNAGITDFGSQKGNPNLAINSQKKHILASPTSKYNYFTFAQNLKKNTYYTVSVDSSSTTTGVTEYSVYLYNLTDSKGIEMLTLPVSSNRKTLTFSVPTSNLDGKNFAILVYSSIAGATENKDLIINNIKIEEGKINTPWCANLTEVSNPVRIWAGASYENRNNAPFRILQNGDLFANNGTFGGRVVGDFDSGKVHIHNNEIVINETSTTLENNGNISARHFSNNAHMRLGQGDSFINTNLILGSLNNRKIEFLNETKQFKFYETDLKIQSNGLTDMLFDSKSPNGAFNGLNLIATVGGGHHVLRHSGTQENAGALVFDSEGSQGSRGDFFFTRKNSVEDCKVEIKGELKIKTGIKSTNQNIEIKSIDGEGWGFYAN